MKAPKWTNIGVLAILFALGIPVFAQGNGHGNGHGKGHDKQESDDDSHYYRQHEWEIRGWYSESENHLPPGLAKKDHLPPGLEKQLVRNGTLPPGLQKRVYPVPVELEHRLPPPPANCAHVFVGGQLVLLNRKTNLVVDVFAF